MYACIPTPNSSYLEKLKPIPDFYGPLWVCITLIFSTAISGNMADFFATLGSDTEWEYDFKKGNSRKYIQYIEYNTDA